MRPLWSAILPSRPLAAVLQLGMSGALSSSSFAQVPSSGVWQGTQGAASQEAQPAQATARQGLCAWVSSM